MIFEFERTKTQGIRLRVKREARPEAEVRLAQLTERLRWAQAALRAQNRYHDSLSADRAADLAKADDA